jgi:hypothetical protein
VTDGRYIVTSLEELSAEELTKRLTYAGFVLVSYERVKSMLVEPIKLFYRDVTFEGGPFRSYEEDVRSRHQNEFEACLLYLRDFMQAIDARDMITIQSLRIHRNELAHDLVERLPTLHIEARRSLFEGVDDTLRRLSAYRAYMEVGADPEFRGIDWNTVKGYEYLLFESILDKIRLLSVMSADTA